MTHKCQDWIFKPHGGTCLRWVIRSRRSKVILARLYSRGDAMIACRELNKSKTIREKWGLIEYRLEAGHP